MMMGVETLGARLEGWGTRILRSGLVLLLLWFGAFKFTEAEAKAIEPLVANNPLTSWLYALLDLRAASALIGASEVAIAILIALRPVSTSLSAVGSLAAAGLFFTTLSFLATTPGSFVWIEGLLVPSATGAFLVKDLLLLGAAVSTAAEALASRGVTAR
jgi:uncharacterized membrane protein YkgB